MPLAFLIRQYACVHVCELGHLQCENLGLPVFVCANLGTCSARNFDQPAFMCTNSGTN